MACQTLGRYPELADFDRGHADCGIVPDAPGVPGSRGETMLNPRMAGVASLMATGLLHD